MILLQDTSWGAGPRGSAAGNNYPINESISAKRGLGYGWIGLEDGGGYGMDENVSNDIACGICDRNCNLSKHCLNTDALLNVKKNILSAG